MLHVKRKIHYKRVDKRLEASVKEYIAKECKHHYASRITKERYEFLEQKIASEVQDVRNGFFVALNEEDEIVGSISIFAYDNRIVSLQKHYHTNDVAEIGRCYIKKEYRREGIGSQLFALAKSFAYSRDYKTLYLHTHHFLPGGFSFWQKMGFEVLSDNGGSWQTVHMERLVREIQYSLAV